MPTRKKDVERFLKITGIKKGDKFYDLGCGDGRLVCAAARAGAKAFGFEISLLPYLLAKARIVFGKCDGAKVHYKSFWKADLGDADIVYLFLMPKIRRKTREKLEREMKRGSRVVAYTWPVEGWAPEKISDEKGQAKYYLYRIK